MRKISAGHRRGGTGSPLGWSDLPVVLLVAVLSLPGLVWFEDNWTVIGNDASRYLYAGSQLISGRGLTEMNGAPQINHGPVLPALVGVLTLMFGRDTETLAWAVRLMAQVNPLLAYFLVRRLSTGAAGLIAAALVTLFGYNTMTSAAFNIDAVLLTFYLASLLALLAAVKRDGPLLALLSGLLLGAAILTKETALMNLPLALLAVLLLDGSVRGALWHYVGLAFVCLPWWVWVWSASGQVYLVGRLPVSMQVPILMVGAILLGASAAAYASGAIDRFLEDERRRRLIGWLVVVAWTVSMTAMLLATGGAALAGLSSDAVAAYLTELLAPVSVVVPGLLLAAGYAVLKAARRDAPWRLLALSLLFQLPVCLLVTVVGWASRQFLIPQTLFFCVLAALVADAGAAAWRERALLRKAASAALAASLAVVLISFSAERVRELLPERSAEAAEREVAPRANSMIDWMAANVPEGERILVNAAQGQYLGFLGGDLYEWAPLRLDQKQCVPRPNVQMRCNPGKNDISRTSPDAVWVQMVGDCQVLSLSMPGLMEQVRDRGSEHIMVAGTPKYPGLLKLPTVLEDSGAFRVLHAEYGYGGKARARQGVVLLKSTGKKPESVPTLMNAATARSLERCERKKGPGYQKRIESMFPNGVLELPG